MAGAALTATGPTTVGPIGTGPGSALARLQANHPLVAQLARFMVVGGLSTALNAGLFLIVTNWLDSVPANLVSLVLSTVVSTEINRRFTFDSAPTDHWRVHVQNSGTVLFYAFYGSIVLLLLDGFVPGASPVLESATVAAASVLGGAARFLVLRYWVFAKHATV
ncbi:GtrA family protein [Pseudonocardia sp. GCM10023141]|uniref:GtrA family protein n=1 Tax=Pseudonocardia sp. GCM10023141 TaxID=3252653 RepID=UPI003611EE06